LHSNTWWETGLFMLVTIQISYLCWNRPNLVNLWWTSSLNVIIFYSASRSDTYWRTCTYWASYLCNIRTCNFSGMIHYNELIFSRISSKIACLDHKITIYTTETINLRKCSKDNIVTPFHLFYLISYHFVIIFSARNCRPKWAWYRKISLVNF